MLEVPRAWFGAIAQLGERVLCKHEVVGSIPSGSTRSCVVNERCSTVSAPLLSSERKQVSSFCVKRDAVLIYIVKREFVRIARKGYAQAAGLTARRWTDSEENWSYIYTALSARFCKSGH